jgi:hypothetical protein
MKVARLFGVALIAIVALSAMLASTASAIPKFKLPITKRGFVGLSGTAVLRTPAEEDTVTCSSAQSPGTILSDDEVDIRIHYLGCSLKQGTKGPCTIKNPGGTAGLLLTELLLGLLGLLHSPEGAAGILFEPKGAPNHVFLTFAGTEAPCTTPETAVEGSVAGLFSPTGKLSSTALIIVAPTSATGKQEVQLILTLFGVVIPKLTSFGAAASTQEQHALVEFEEKVEVD